MRLMQLAVVISLPLASGCVDTPKKGDTTPRVLKPSLGAGATEEEVLASTSGVSAETIRKWMGKSTP